MNKNYIFKQGDKFVGMDNASGGYPYLTENPLQVKLWHDLAEALKYADRFQENWSLHIFIGIDTILIANVDEITRLGMKGVA